MKSIFAVLGADKGIVHVADGAEGFHDVSMGVGYVEVDYACPLSCYRESYLDVIVNGEAESFGFFLTSWYGEAHGNALTAGTRSKTIAAARNEYTRRFLIRTIIIHQLRKPITIMNLE